MATATQNVATPGITLPDGKIACRICGNILQDSETPEVRARGCVHAATGDAKCRNISRKEIRVGYPADLAKARADAYEVWEGVGWTWYVLAKRQTSDVQQYAIWYCLVTSPYTPEGELGDTYAADVRSSARRVK